MRAMGIIRRLDELGRVVIPVEMRRMLDLADRDTVEIAVQVNGKVKARLKVAADIDAAAAIAAAKADPAVAAALEGKQVVKELFVKGRLVNLAVKG